MAQYKMLVDHFVNNQVLPAGSIQTTKDASASGLLPANWTPSPNVDPLDTPAVDAYWAAGAANIDFLLASYAFSNGMGPTWFRSVVPQTYWNATPVGANTQFKLTGLGSALAPVMV